MCYMQRKPHPLQEEYSNEQASDQTGSWALWFSGQRHEQDDLGSQPQGAKAAISKAALLCQILGQPQCRQQEAGSQALCSMALPGAVLLHCHRKQLCLGPESLA